MTAVVIFFAFATLSQSHLVTCSGTIYQKVTEAEVDVNVHTMGFHQCSLKGGCKFAGIPVGNADDEVYLAETMQELENINRKLDIWKKIEPEDTEQNKSSVQALKDCKEAMKAGMLQNGTVELTLANNTKIKVYCDMATDGGGWIVFQRRINNETSFERDWQTYEKGFGDLDGNFWLGLEALYNLTSNGNWTLRVDLKALDGDRGYAKYTNFTIGSKQAKYMLQFDRFSGNIGDALVHSKGMLFTTFDSDNDLNRGTNCAVYSKGGWWHNKCYFAMLNNLYPGSEKNVTGYRTTEMSWWNWRKTFGDIVFSEMKMKIEV